MNEVIDKIIKELKEPMLYLNKINLERLKEVKELINYIINNNIIDEKIIERTFDDLLDLTYFYGEELYELYFNFLKYYNNINSESSNDYKKFYIEIIKE